MPTRTEFLRKSRAYYRRYRTPGAQVPPRSRARHALVRPGLRRTYGMLRRTSAMGRRAVRQSARLIRWARGHWRGSGSAQLRSAFRERFCPYDDGCAAERVVRRVVLGEADADLPAVVPFTERHRYRRSRPLRCRGFRSRRGLPTDHGPDTGRARLPTASPQGVPLPSSPSRPTPTRPHTWRPAGRPGRATR